MTECKLTKKERAQATLKKLIAASIQPITLKALEQVTGVSKSHIRTLICCKYENLFKRAGFEASQSGGPRHKLFQSKTDAECIEPNIESVGVVYRNLRAKKHSAEYLTWAKQQRLERKSSRTHVGIADYAAFV